MGIGAVVNAVAFSGSFALFSMSTEAKRQKEADAIEKFQEDLAAWNQRKAGRAEFLANRQKEIAAAAASDKKILNTLLLYQQYFGPNNIPVDQTPI